MKFMLKQGLVLVVLVFFSCHGREKKEKIHFWGEAQGTYYSIIYYAADTIVSQNEIDSLLKEFDMVASLWQYNSLISRLNRNETSDAGHPWFQEMFKLSQQVSEQTSGAFDITVGPLVNAWGFGFKNRIELTQAMIDSIMRFVGYRLVEMENGNLKKSHPNIQLDLNAIAAGYAVDLLGKFLEVHGITDYLIDLGGEIRIRGYKPGREKWIIGIEKPAEAADSDRILQTMIKATDISVATSGNYRKFYVKDGVRYSHTIDPSTGYPVTHTLLSATVIASSTALADAYATAFMVMGLEKSKQFLEKNQGLEAYLIYSDESGNMKIYSTPGLKRLIIEQ